jgi:hypothetical protein
MDTSGALGLCAVQGSELKLKDAAARLCAAAFADNLNELQRLVENGASPLVVHHVTRPCLTRPGGLVSTAEV